MEVDIIMYVPNESHVQMYSTARLYQTEVLATVAELGQVW